jgi:hypothetical protein
MAPKVFVSHASEDKERFVIPFATALRAKGIDAWIDRWEMKLGDSLVDKIFEEGLKEAAAIIVVLSNVSVQKPWVKEELNAAVVKRIEKGTRIIPLVLDGCAVPEALRHIVWELVSDPNNFGATLTRVVDEILEKSFRPPLGESPSYFSAPSTRQIGGLTAADQTVLAVLYDAFLFNSSSYVDPDELALKMPQKGLDEAMVTDSLAVLEHKGYAEIVKTLGGPWHSRLTSLGVSVLLGEKESELVRQVGLCILNDGIQKAAEIALSVGSPLPLVEHAIDRLEAGGHLIASKYISEPPTVIMVHPTLRRYLAD